MWHYYGLDWVRFGALLGAIWHLVRKPKRTVGLFLFADLTGIALSLITTPIVWGGVAGGVCFLAMNVRNLICLRKSSSTPEATTTKPKSGSTGRWSLFGRRTTKK